MDDVPTATERPPASAGLCHRCRHAQVILSATGSRFTRCRRSRGDPAYAKYPPLPVTHCAGFDAEP